MALKIFKILEKDYIKKFFEKKRGLYFPSLKNKKIVDIQIKKESPDWAENSCLAKYKIFFSNSNSKTIRGTSHIDGSRERSFKILKFLYQKNPQPDLFEIPRPLDYLKETKTLLYEEVEGTPLSLLLEKERTKSIEKIFEKTAYFLSFLHSIKGIRGKAKFLTLKDYRKTFWQIKKIFPEFSSLIPPLKKISFLESLKKPSDFLHGDFYPSNVIVNENKIGIIDFDKSGRGHFFADLSSFVYWFDLPKIKPIKFSEKEIKKFREIFLKIYCQKKNLDFLKTREKLEKFKVKTFLDCLHYVTILSYYGWKKIDKKLKGQFRGSTKNILKKIKNSL
jgi:hypothetical protein